MLHRTGQVGLTRRSILVWATVRGGHRGHLPLGPTDLALTRLPTSRHMAARAALEEPRGD